MKKSLYALLILGGSLLFTLFFYNTYIGLNLALFELVCIAGLLAIKRLPLKHSKVAIVLAGTFLTAVFFVINYSGFTVFINILSFGLLIGVVAFPEARSLLTSAATGMANLVKAQGQFFGVIESLFKNRQQARTVFKYLKIIAIPLLIIFLFVVLYRYANPVFEKYVLSVSAFISDIFGSLFKHFNGALFFTFILGVLVCNFVFLSRPQKAFTEADQSGDNHLRRKRKRPMYPVSFKPLALLNEYKAAVFLLTALNILILIINIIDINWVWINFEWDGDYLKQFVHEGTYLLIISILISIGITLYFFRGNLNFYRKNRFLTWLAYIWLGQNAILTISVAIRNLWYISYFALAYKRIGVIFFLLLTLYGIYTVIMKIRHKKSAFFLFRRNSMAMYLVLVFIALFNWDSIIARYNLKHYERSFVHFDYLATLSYKTLPTLDVSEQQLNTIEKTQDELFPFADKYMTAKEFENRIEQRKTAFIDLWKQKGFFSWNYAEYKAYKALTNSE